MIRTVTVARAGRAAVTGRDAFTDATARSVAQWARDHKPGSRGAHDYDLVDYGLTPEGVRKRFVEYLATYDASA